MHDRFHSVLYICIICLCSSVFGQSGFLPYLAQFSASTNATCNATWSNAVSQLRSQGCLDLTPIPTNSYDPRAPAGTYSAVEVKPNLWWITEGIYGALLYYHPHEPVILVDAPPTHLGQLRDKVNQITRGKGVDVLIYSHHHMDHIGGARYITDRWRHVQIIAHTAVKHLLLQAFELKVPLPTTTFSSTYHIGPFHLIDTEEAHSPGNCFIYAPHHELLMVVDIIFPGWVPFYNWAITQNYVRFLQLPSEILNRFKFDIIIGGHLTRPGNRHDVQMQDQFYHDLQQAAKDAMAQVTTEQVVADLGKDAADTWVVFDTVVNRVVQLCYNTMVTKYRGVLGGVEAQTASQCFTMREFLEVG